MQLRAYFLFEWIRVIILTVSEWHKRPPDPVSELWFREDTHCIGVGGQRSDLRAMEDDAGSDSHADEFGGFRRVGRNRRTRFARVCLWIVRLYCPR
ncbi:hypothetical protein BG842_25055 [Haladaptatus sp. W1]|nr:hypothetical protein BG842_25055 [Haladaptatus sp. W1]